VIAWSDGQGNGQDADNFSQLLSGVSSLGPNTLNAASGVSSAESTGSVASGVLTLNGVADGWAVANSALSFSDTITIVSNTLPTGTPVTFFVSMDIDYSLLAGCPNSASGVQGNFSLGFNDLQYSDSMCFGPGPNVQSAVMQFEVGDVIALLAQLQIYAGSGNCCDPGHAETKAILRFFIDPTEDTFSYTTESGHVYLTPDSTEVPEPRTWLMLIAGLIALPILRK
jgi:hypothetical protein